MSLPKVSSSSTQASMFSSFGEPLVVRMFGEEILEIFLDKTAFLFGILSNPKKGVLRKRVTFLPLQPVLPEQIRALQKLLSPEMSCLRLKHLNVIQIEPKLLGGGTKTSIDPEIQTAQELFLTLSELTKENIVGTDQREVFEKISILSKALPSLSSNKNRLADAWYVAKALHMAVDVLLLTIWDKEKEDDQNTRYSFEQKEAILKPIRNAKGILERHNLPMRKVTLLSLDLAETGIRLLPELDMKAKDWKVFVQIGEALNTSFTPTESSESDNSQEVSKLLTNLWPNPGEYWAVSPNLYGDSILARIILLNKTLQVSKLTDLLKCSPIKETLSLQQSEKNSDSIFRHLLALDRLSSLSLYEPREDLREQAFYTIGSWAESENEVLRKSAILYLTQISLLSQDPFIKREALEILDPLNLSQKEDQFLSSYRNWVIDNLPRGHLDEENLKIEQAFERARDQGFFNAIKRLTFCAADESIHPLFLEDGPDSLESTFQKLVNLGLIEENNGAHKISKQTQDRLKKLIPKKEQDTILHELASSINRAWNFDAPIDQQGSIPLHLRSFIENILKENQTGDSLVFVSIAFFLAAGRYHLLVKRDLQKALESFKKALESFDLLSRETEGETYPSSILSQKQEAALLFRICCSIDQNKFEINSLSNYDLLLGLEISRALTRTFSNISSFKINTLSIASIEDLNFLITQDNKKSRDNVFARIIDEVFERIKHEMEDLDFLIIRSEAIKRIKNESIKRITFNGVGHLDLFEIRHKTMESLDFLITRIEAIKKIKNEALESIKGRTFESISLRHEALNSYISRALDSLETTGFNPFNLNLELNKLILERAKAVTDTFLTWPLPGYGLNAPLFSLVFDSFATTLPASQLTHLDLSGNKISPEGAQALATALGKSQLTYLDLSWNKIDSRGAKALAIALPTSQLTHLDLSGNKIGTEGARALAASLSTSQLTHLDLSWNKIGAEGVGDLATSLPTSQLTHLDLSWNKINAEGLQALATSLPTSQLTNLILQGSQTGAEGARALAAALKASKLTNLNLWDNSINVEGAQSLAQALPTSKLTNLNLGYNNITAQGTQALAKALPISQLTNLDLSWNKIGARGAQALATALPTSQLTHLNLGSNNITAQGAQALAAALKASKLTNLNLRSNNITAQGTQALAAVLPTSKLTNLNLGSNDIKAQGAQALAEALPTSQLTHLDLDENNIGAGEAKVLAAALTSSQLTNLNLVANEIGDEGAKALATALATSQLTKLNLGWNSICNEGAKALAVALPISKLTNLNLSSNPIESEGAKVLVPAIRASKLTNFKWKRLSLSHQLLFFFRTNFIGSSDNTVFLERIVMDDN